MIENHTEIGYDTGMALAEDYIEKLKTRSRESRVYRKYQFVGLEIADLLEDPGHKSLYIKLAKEHDAEKLLRFAKEILQNKNVKKKGAYFMKVWTSENALRPIRPTEHRPGRVERRKRPSE